MCRMGIRGAHRVGSISMWGRYCLQKIHVQRERKVQQGGAHIEEEGSHVEKKTIERKPIGKRFFGEPRGEMQRTEQFGRRGWSMAKERYRFAAVFCCSSAHRLRVCQRSAHTP